jgi:acyl carrier protein
VKIDTLDSRRQKVVEILKKVLNEPDSSGVLNRHNPSWDSLKQLQISIEIEDYFEVELSDEQAVEFFDVDSILDLLERVAKNGS